MEGHACLTGRDVGLSDKGGSGPTWLSWKEGTRLPGRCQRRRLTTAIFHGTSPRGEQSYAVCSRRSTNGESVSEKLYWARKIATEGQYGHFVKAEKSEEQMACSQYKLTT